MFSYKFEMFSITVDCVILCIENSKKNILLIQRAHEPCSGFWALPGGYVETTETLTMAAGRELFEETGIKDVELNFIGIFDDINRDPMKRVISIGFYVILQKKTMQEHKCGEILKMQWFDVDYLPTLAFDHLSIIKTALNVLKYE